MKLKLIFLAILLAFTSCSSSNDEIETQKEQDIAIEVGNVNKMSWYFPFMYPTTEKEDSNYYFEYDSQNRISKRIGALVPISQSTGFSYVTSNKAYIEVIYNSNSITASSYVSNPGGVSPLGKKVFELDNQGRIIKCTIFNRLNIAYEEWIYHYDNSGKLADRVTRPAGAAYNDLIERFTYDSNGNLVNAKTSYLMNDVEFRVKSEIQFTNYDKVPSSFKKIGIFDEHFYLSLSKNNPQKKITLEYAGGELASKQEVWWTNQYNADGTIKLFY